jgi:mono/diheme cytochrome c family protein
VPRERRAPEPFEETWLERSLRRHLMAGLVFMAVLLVGFVVYKAREPGLREDAAREQRITYTGLGLRLFDDNCASCHGEGGTGGDAPVLNAREFLASTADEQIRLLTSGGVSGTDMPAWSIDFGGTLTDEQIRQLVTYIRSLEADAPSVPEWREGRPGSDEHADEHTGEDAGG